MSRIHSCASGGSRGENLSPRSNSAKKGFFHVFSEEEQRGFNNLGMGTRKNGTRVILPALKISKVLKAFKKGSFWADDYCAVSLIQQDGEDTVTYLRTVKFKPTKSRSRYWCTQITSEDQVVIHQFEDTKKRKPNHMIAKFTLRHLEGVGLQIEFREKCTGANIHFGSKQRIRRRQNSILRRLVSRIEDSDESSTVLAPIFCDPVVCEDWQELDIAEVTTKMKESLEVSNRRRKGVLVKSAFIGNEAVDFLLEEFGLTSRELAVELLQHMLEQDIFQVTSRREEKGHKVFRDDRVFYKWPKPVSFDKVVAELSREHLLKEPAVQSKWAHMDYPPPPPLLPDRDTTMLASGAACALMLASFSSLGWIPAIALLVLCLVIYRYAVRRGRRLERKFLVSKFPKAPPAEEVKEEAAPVAPTPVASNCLLSSFGEIAAPNDEPIQFENEYSQGRALLKTKTTPIDPRVASYFQGKNREFEMQVQFSLKEPLAPDEAIFVGMEVPGDLNLSYGKKFLCSTIVNALKLFNKTLHSSFGTEDERPHITFPFRVMPDSLIVTPPGEKPPDLTHGFLPIGKAPASELKMEPGYIYTLSFYSQYVSMERWVITKLPGFADISLATVWGDHPFHVVGYIVKQKKRGDKTLNHSIHTRKLVLNLEISHKTNAKYKENMENLTQGRSPNHSPNPKI